MMRRPVSDMSRTQEPAPNNGFRSAGPENDRDRRPADHRVEERPERVEERLVIEKGVDLGQVTGQAHEALGDHRLPEGGRRAYGTDQGGLNPFCDKGLRPS